MPDVAKFAPFESVQGAESLLLLRVSWHTGKRLGGSIHAEFAVSERASLRPKVALAWDCSCLPRAFCNISGLVILTQITADGVVSCWCCVMRQWHAMVPPGSFDAPHRIDAKHRRVPGLFYDTLLGSPQVFGPWQAWGRCPLGGWGCWFLHLFFRPRRRQFHCTPICCFSL